MSPTPAQSPADTDPRILDYVSAIFSMASRIEGNALDGLKRYKEAAPKLTAIELSYAEDHRVAEIFCGVSGFPNIKVRSRAEAFGRLIAVLIKSNNPATCGEAMVLAQRMARLQNANVTSEGLVAAPPTSSPWKTRMMQRWATPSPGWLITRRPVIPLALCMECGGRQTRADSYPTIDRQIARLST